MKNRNKGFTLFEILIMIAIISTVGVGAAIVFVNSIRVSNEAKYDKMVTQIVDAAKVYVETDETLLQTLDIEKEFKITIGTLQETGLLSWNIKNPINNTEVSSFSYVLVSKYEADKIKYEFIDESGMVYIDSSKANAPVLYQGLIPIKWNGSNWVRADIYEEWYDYNNKEWANAVLVTDSSRKYYLSDNSIGEIVSEEDILAYFVWIPRFKYKLFSSPTEQEIEIAFETNGITTGVGTQVGEWKTHPAFTFGNTILKGFWVGKFETGYEGAYVLEEAEAGIANPSKLVIKPNVYSWRAIDVDNMHLNAIGMESTDNRFDLRASQVDPHVMKNSEWGAVAYLSQSTYGKNSKIWKNPNNEYKTGCAGDSDVAESSSICNSYETELGVNASTTGNITGIYDMSGGSYELVMGNYQKTIYTSGFQIFPAPKYYDVYNAASINNMCNGECLGHALSETSGWYSSAQEYVESTKMWFKRGGVNFSTNANIFSYDKNNGSGNTNIGFRIVISGKSSTSENNLPEIALIGDSTIEIEENGEYIEQGAIAYSYKDGYISDQIEISGEVNTAAIGEYTITYSITDSLNQTASVQRLVNVVPSAFIHRYPFTGAVQTFVVPEDGIYKIELWGGRGNNGAEGGYVKGEIYLTQGTVLNIYVGGGNVSSSGTANWNGGGSGGMYKQKVGGGGGGATDIRVNGTTLNDRIMVAGAGAGGATCSDKGYGGGLTGYTAYHSYESGKYCGKGGKQNAGGSAASKYINSEGSITSGTFGKGGNGNQSDNEGYGSGGGGGYYGGGGGSGGNTSGWCGGGGSSFISGHSGCNAVNSSGAHTGQPDHFSGYVFTNTVMIDGAGYNWTDVKGEQVQMPKPDGSYYDLGVGHTGNGYAKITLFAPAEVVYYDYGVENVPFVEGYKYGPGSASKGSTYLNLYVGPTSTWAQRTYVSDVPVDLTYINTLFVNWSLGADTSGSVHLVVSTDKAGKHDVYDKKLSHGNPFDTTEESLDVSDLTGPYYIRVHIYQPYGNNRKNRSHVNQIRGEL